ncbi:MAG TPA: tetratricopeptide repeat protein [Rhodospirillales bacterium]|nr:tetratricopeptide repeat protein [Rhodospirillales bacterium]
MTAEKPKNLPGPNIKAAWDDIKQGNFDEALRRVGNISKDSRDYTESRLILARVAWLQGFTEAAMVILDESAANNPDSSRILTDIAVLQLNDEQTDKALGTLDKAAENSSLLPEAEIARYAALRRLGKKEQASEALKSLYDKVLTGS